MLRQQPRRLKCWIFTDSQSTLNKLPSTINDEDYNSYSLRNELNQLILNNDLGLEMRFCRGHTCSKGNERADTAVDIDKFPEDLKTGKDYPWATTNTKLTAKNAL